MAHAGVWMTPFRSGFTDRPDANGLPEVQLTDLEIVAELYDQDSGESFRSLEALVDRDDISLRHSAGYLEPGGRYAVFLVFWDVGEFLMIYAHDLETDLPAHGFLSEASSEILRKMEAFRPEGCNLDRIIDLAVDSRIVEAGGEESELLKVLWQRPEDVSDLVAQQNFGSTDVPGRFPGLSEDTMDC